MALHNHSNSTTVIGDAGMAEDAFSKSKFKKPPKVVLESTRPEKVKRLHEKQLGIMDVFDYHIGDDRNWLTATQMRVLHYFFARFATESKIDMTDVPYELKLKQATVNRIVQTFSGNEKFGKSVNWFNSERMLSDARKVLLSLTTAGHQVMNDLTLAMQVEIYSGYNPNVELYRRAEEAAKAKIALKVDSGDNITIKNLGVKADVYSQIKGTGEVGNVEIKTENVTTGAPEVPEATLQLGGDTTAILAQVQKRRLAKKKYDAWRTTADGQEYFARREGKIPLGQPVLTRNGERIEPPVDMKDLIWSNEKCTAFAVQMVRALDEQVSTEAREQLLQQVIEALPLREWDVVKDHLRQDNDNKLRTRKWLAEEQKRVMAQASTIASPSERHEFLAAAYAEQASAEGQREAQIRDKWEQAANEKQADMEQLREQIANELRVTLRQEIREEVKQELLKKLS